MLDDGGIHAIVNAYGADILSHEQMQIERDSLQHGAVTTDIVSNSIRTHMFPLTPIPPKYLEGVIVNIADTLCAIRETLSPSRFHAAKP